MKRTTYPPGLPYELFAQWDWYRDAPATVRHKGVAHYDRERMRLVLRPITLPHDANWSEPPTSWPAGWEWPEGGLPPGYFHNGPIAPREIVTQTAERETADYTLRNVGEDLPWRVEFADAAFSFRTLAIAETAIPELLKIRKASHPKPTTLSKRAPSCVFFTAKRQRELPEDKTMEPETELVAA